MVKNSTAAKLAAYGAMGVGSVTFGASAANADIVYTDLTGSELFFTSTSPVDIDVDNDGNADFSLELGTFGPNAFSTSSWLMNLRAAAPNNNVAANSAFGGLYNLGAGSSISSRNFSRTAGYLQQDYTSFNPGNVYGAWLPGQFGYAGVRFVDGDGATRFGWIEMAAQGTVANGDFTDIEVTVSGYAYAIGESIVAGQTSSIPEPTAIGLLALGGVGIMARRRRKEES